MSDIRLCYGCGALSVKPGGAFGTCADWPGCATTIEPPRCEACGASSHLVAMKGETLCVSLTDCINRQKAESEDEDAECVGCAAPLGVAILPGETALRCRTCARAKKTHDTILHEALHITTGARNTDYGPPRHNHGCTATLNFPEEHVQALHVTARDVCWLNILQKASRDAHLAQRDNLVDVAGYAANADEMETNNE